MFERIEVGSPSRPWATALAFLVNSTALTLAILLPMIKPDQLPAFTTFHEITPPYSAPRTEAPPETRAQPVRAASAAIDQSFRVPSSIPTRTDMTPDKPSEAVPQTNIIGTGFNDPRLVVGLPFATTSNPPPIPTAPPKPRPEKLIISHLDEGMLLRRVQPVYSRLAIASRTQGTVVLSALINTRGEIEGLQVVSGPGLLVQSALDAVKQWRYRPYILNGTPIEVQTQITVNFSLQ